MTGSGTFWNAKYVASSTVAGSTGTGMKILSKLLSALKLGIYGQG